MKDRYSFAFVKRMFVPGIFLLFCLSLNAQTYSSDAPIGSYLSCPDGGDFQSNCPVNPTTYFDDGIQAGILTQSGATFTIRARNCGGGGFGGNGTMFFKIGGVCGQNIPGAQTSVSAGQSFVQFDYTATHVGGDVEIWAVFASDPVTGSGQRFYADPIVITATPAQTDVTVTQPSGGTFDLGCSMNIAWDLDNGQATTTDLELITLSGNNVLVIETALNNNVSSFNWTIGNDESNDWNASVTPGNYRIKAVTYNASDNVVATDNSNTFSISTPSIEVTEPDNGTLIANGSNYQIEWNSDNFCGDVNIELFNDGGNNFIETIASGTNNDGSYNWNTNGVQEGFYRVKIYRRINGDDSSNPSDLGDIFQIGSQVGSISVNSPGGNVRYRSNNMVVSWSSSGIQGNLVLELVRSNTTTAVALIDNDVSLNGSLTWEVGESQPFGNPPAFNAPYYPSNITPGQYQFKMYDTGNPNGTVTYSSPFPIADPTIQIDQPNGGELFNVGDNVQINWQTFNYAGAIAIEYTNPNETDPVVIEAATSNDGNYSWNTTGTPAGNYKIKMYRPVIGDSPAVDFSNNSFTLTNAGAADLTITSGIDIDPGTLVGGETANISVDLQNLGGLPFSGTVFLQLADEVGNFVLDLDMESLNNYQPGSSAVTLSNNNWILPSAGDYRINVLYQEAGNNDFEFVSPGDFVNPLTFTVDAPPASLTLQSPDGGEQYDWGDTPNFNWTSTGDIDFVNLEFRSVNDADDRATVASIIPNTGNYAGYEIDYCVPEGDYNIVIYAVNSFGAPIGFSDFSTGIVSVTKTADYDLSITSPTAGQIVVAGEIFPAITWTSTGGVGNVTLELRGIGGGAFQQTIALNTENDGVVDDYVLPESTPTGMYRIRIFNEDCEIKGGVNDDSPTFTVIGGQVGNQTCNFSSPTPVETEVYAAVSYLCGNGILDDPQGGSFNTDQLIIKEDLAKVAFLGLTDGVQSQATYADFFPVPFIDMQAGEPFQRFGKVLSYLEYGDGVSPFNRRFANYRPASNITRGQVCKVYCEAFDVDVNSLLPQFFNDVPSSHPESAYINTLAALDVLNNDTNGGNFRPNDFATRGEAFIILQRFLENCSACTENKITNFNNEEDFFDPGNYTPDNLGRHPSISDGNFDSYSATGLYLADRGMPLVFSHSYNSYLTELPDELFPSYPLGTGWTHSFHAYITRIEATNTTIPHFVVTWPGGTMHYYRDDGSSNPEPLTSGIYDETTFDQSTGSFTVRKKNQVTFTFSKVNGAEDSPYYLKEIRDRNQNIITLAYEVFTATEENAAGEFINVNRARLDEVTGTTGRKFIFTYYGATDKINMVQETGLNRSIRFEHFGNFPEFDNRLKDYRDAENHVSTYNYSTEVGEDFLLSLVTLPNGNFMSNSYQDGKLNSSLTNDSGTGNAIQTDVNWGLNAGGSGTTSTITIMDGEDDRDYTYTTNALGKIEEIETMGNDAMVLYEDNDNPTLPTSVTVTQGNFELTTTYVYDDENGNVMEVHQEEEVDHFFTYTNLNDVATYRNPRDFTTTFVYGDGLNLTRIEAPIGTTVIDYQSFGLVDQVTNPEGITVRYDYDQYGNVEKMTAPLGLISEADYDAGSRLREFINPNSQRSTYEYDGRNLTESMTRHLEFPQQEQITTGYDFDGNGNLRSITNALGYETTLEYNYFDWLESESFGDATREYDYFDDGKLKRITRPDGTELNYNYFFNNNLLQSDGYATYTYDNLNRLESVTKDGNSITYTYDDLNRVRSISYGGRTIDYRYDENSNLIKLIYPGGVDVDYTYDANDRMKTVTDWLGNVTEYFYLTDGRINYMTNANGTRTEYFYDAAGRMDSMVNKAGATIISAYGFTLDNVGNHTQERKTEPLGIPTYVPLSETDYDYDNDNEINQGGGVTFSHDANGNIDGMSGGYSLALTWDDHDMPTAMSGDFNVTYTYDGLGHRRSATRANITTNYVLDILGMSRILIEENVNGNAENYFVYGLGLISRIKADDNSVRNFHYDFRGSTIAMTDESAAVTHSYQYDDFGRTMMANEEDLNRFQFVGSFGVMRENDRLLFMRARYYDVEIGRFLSEDPVRHENRYSYSSENSVNRGDPLGTTDYHFVEISGDLSLSLDTWAQLAEDLPTSYQLGPYAPALTAAGGALGFISMSVDVMDKAESGDVEGALWSYGKYVSAATVTALASAGAEATLGGAFGGPVSIAVGFVAVPVANDIEVMWTQGIGAMSEEGSYIWSNSQKVGNSLERFHNWGFKNVGKPMSRAGDYVAEKTFTGLSNYMEFMMEKQFGGL